MATYSITEWSEHQHYKDRDPTWVKLYQKTLTSITWLKADLLARTIMIASLLLAARYKNAIPIDEDVLIPALAPRSTKWGDVMIALRYLHDSGFLAISSDDGLALAYSREAEKQSQKKKTPPSSPQGEEHESFAAFWQAYPSRGKAANPRKPAARAFKAAVNRGADPGELIRIAPTAAPAEKHGTEFVPQAVTWLTEDRWKDAPKVDVAQKPLDEVIIWRDRVRIWATSTSVPDLRFWPDAWGPAPHKNNPKIPSAVIAEFNLDGLTPPRELDASLRTKVTEAA